MPIVHYTYKGPKYITQSSLSPCLIRSILNLMLLIYSPAYYVLTLFPIPFIETLPEVKTDLRPYGPREDSTLSEFQMELIQLASQLNGDHVLNSYPNIGESMTVGEANRYAEDAVKRFLEAGRAAIKAGANDSAFITMRPSLTSRVAVKDSRKHLESY